MVSKMPTPSFFTLSAELRIKIYSTLFGHGRMTVDKYAPNTLEDVTYAHPVARSAQILRVCRTIRAEASDVFMDQTEVHFTRLAFDLKMLSWGNIAPTTPLQARKIRHLSFEVDMYLLNDIDVTTMMEMDMPKLQTVKLACMIPYWKTEMHWIGFSRNANFTTARQAMEILACAFSVKTPVELDWEDRSIPGKKVVLEMRAKGAR